MKQRALVVTYHAIEPDASPLSVDAALLAEHLDRVASSGATTLTVSALAEAARAGRLPDRAVALTFDDGFASVAELAAPLLLERGLVATVFCVAGRLGGSSDWPSQRSSVAGRPLATAAQLAELARQGWEIGSHGLDHEPLPNLARASLPHELGESRRILEEATESPVRAFAYPYGATVPALVPLLAEAGYGAACTTRIGIVGPSVSPFALPRVDVHYIRAPRRFESALEGSSTLYLGARGAAARARRLLLSDYR